MNKPPLTVSVNPWYYCNLRCEFCYLTPEQLSSKTLLDLDVLSQRLDEIGQLYDIQHVDIYGGEVLLLPERYLEDLRDLLLARGLDDIVLITNLTLVPEIVSDPSFELSVSYDFDAREKGDIVFGNMLQLEQPFTVLSLASPEFLKTVTPDMYVEAMNMLGNLRGCEIKPYSANQANNLPVKYSEFEDFVWEVINHPARSFHFENEVQVDMALSGEHNSYSDDHLYITPTGDMAVLEFDLNDLEYFMVVDSVEAYRTWCDLERTRVNDNPICKECPYLGTCLSEHLREVTTLEDSCNGFRGLLDKRAVQLI